MPPTLRALLLLLLGLALAPPARGGPEPDALDEALAAVGAGRDDLGIRPRGWWVRWPEVPHRLRHVDDLMAHPLATVPWLRHMAASMVEHLDPVAETREGVRGASWLHQAVLDLGIARRFGGLRAYSANLEPDAVALDEALLACWAEAGRSTTHRSFGEVSPYPRLREGLAEATAPLDAETSGVLGRLVLDLLDARRWAARAFRAVDLETRVAVARRLDLGMEAVDALDYEPALDDALRAWDEASLWYASVKTAEALERARLALLGLVFRPDPLTGTVMRTGLLDDLLIDVSTPLGRIVVAGTGDDVVSVGEEGAFLVVDLAGDDRHEGRVAASSPTLPVAALLDLDGDDHYLADDLAQGVGMVGVGVLLEGAGDDLYEAKGDVAQGFGQLGFGLLADLGGRDLYEVRHGGQGCAFFGVGLLFDRAGIDAYRAWSEAQGHGGVGGVGVLADRSGDDEYVLEPSAAVTGRPSYHSELEVSVSNGQGCAMGRRGDGADGHSWAGGLGALLDGAGDDVYKAGNWAQGCGYWFGTGALWDGGGDDEYRANGWASASGAHFCIGVKVDEGGDDHHVVEQGWGPAYGHDFTVAVLLDADGDDRYVAGRSGGIAWSINRSTVLLVDEAGDDLFLLLEPGEEGHAANAPLSDRYAGGPTTSRYWSEATSAAVLLDLGGTDDHRHGEAGPLARDGTSWHEGPDGPGPAARNWAVGVDREGGRVRWGP